MLKKTKKNIWGINTFMKKGADLPQNIMRSQKIMEAITVGKKRFSKLYPADIGMALDINLPINSVMKECEIQAAQIIAAEPELMRYTEPQGLKIFREAVSNFYRKIWKLNIDPQWVVITNGASEMWERFISAHFESGDLVLTPDPHYNPFNTDLAAIGAGWLSINTESKNGYHFTKQDVDTALAKKPKEGKIKALYLNSPCNPTGVVYTQKELDILVDLALKNDLFIVMDGVYSLYNYSNNPTLIDYLRNLSVKKRNKIYKKLVFLDSMSKLAQVPGTRIGINLIPDNMLREQTMRTLLVRGNVQNHGQIFSLFILNKIVEKPNIILTIKSLYKRKMGLFYRSIHKDLVENNIIPDFHMPEGGLYLTLNILRNSSKFLIWSMNEYKGKEAMTFVPLTVEFEDGSVSSFRAKDLETGSDELRICIGMPEEDILPASKAFIKQLQQFIRPDSPTT